MMDASVGSVRNGRQPDANVPADGVVELLELADQRTATGIRPGERPDLSSYGTGLSSVLRRLLRTRRVCLGLTQEQLAEQTGLSVRTISGIERGEIVSPRRTSIQCLCEALALPWAQFSDWLYGDAVTPTADAEVSAAEDGSELTLHVDVVPRQVPPGARHFAGRKQELTALDNILRDADSWPIIVVVSGPEGVGKTALALDWAHANAARFPDGQLYADFHGTSRSGVPARSAWDVLRSFLESLGRPTDRIPFGLDQLSAFYRSVLADRRMLIILDQVSSIEQARPLLPASRGSMVLLTSRHTLADLVANEGAFELVLGELDRADSLQLLVNLLGEQRVAAERRQVSALITRCAGLPSVLSSMAAQAVTRPGVSLAAIEADLACEEADGLLPGPTVRPALSQGRACADQASSSRSRF